MHAKSPGQIAYEAAVESIWNRLGRSATLGVIKFEEPDWEAAAAAVIAEHAGRAATDQHVMNGFLRQVGAPLDD